VTKFVTVNVAVKASEDVCSRNAKEPITELPYRKIIDMFSIKYTRDIWVLI